MREREKAARRKYAEWTRGHGWGRKERREAKKVEIEGGGREGMSGESASRKKRDGREAEREREEGGMSDGEGGKGKRGRQEGGMINREGERIWRVIR